MRLSTAIMLGAVTVKMEAGDMNSCALGAACNALGAAKHDDNVMMYGDVVANCIDRYVFVWKKWPWLKSDMDYTTFDGIEKCGALRAVFNRFDLGVVLGLMTLEQLVDYVRSIEPECGECNEFSCKCVQKMDETPALQLQEVTQ